MDQITIAKPLHLKKLIVWCAISSHGIAELFIVEGTMNSARYIKMLNNNFFPYLRKNRYVRNHWFMQDGARPHRTRDVFETLKI